MLKTSSGIPRASQNITERKQAEARLARSQDMLARTEGIAHLGSWEWDVATDTMTWSDQLFRIFQRNPAAGPPSFAEHSELYCPEDVQRLKAALASAVSHGTPYELEVSAIRKDGQTRVCLARGHAEMGPDGTASLLFGSLQDITECMQADEALKKSEAFTRTVLDSVSDQVAVIDQDGVITAVNAIWRCLALENSPTPGSPVPGTDIGANYLEICHPGTRSAADSSEAAREGIQAVLDGRLSTFSLEYPCHSPDQRRWFRMRVSPLGLDRRGAVIAHTNITDQIMANDALRQSEDLLKSMTAAVPGVVYQFSRTPDGEWKFLYLSKGIEDLYEVTAEEACRDHSVLTECIVPDDRTSHRESVERSALALNFWAHEYRIRTPGGNLKWVHGEATPKQLDDGIVLWNGILTDVTARKHTEKALKESEERWKFALEGAGDGVWDWNIQTGAATYSKRWKEMIGFTESEIENHSSEWTNRVHPGDMPSVMTSIQAHIDGRTPSAAVEFRMLCKDGSWRWILGRGMVVSRDADGKPLRMVGTNADITASKQIEEQVRQMAFYDSLTCLPNRRLLNDRLSLAMAANKRSGCYGALMFLDLDNFKQLNDTHGHDVGDLVLIEVADRLKSCVREMDTVARFGGDEFVVMISELVADLADATSQAKSVAEKVRSALLEPYRLAIKYDGKGDATATHRCTASIGIVLFNHDARTDDVLKWADAAMYQAKEDGRNLIRFYDSDGRATA